MNQVNELREMVATMLRLPPDEIVPETSLANLHNSLSGARLKIGLKRLGLSMPTASSPATFGDLEAALFGKAPAKAPAAPCGGEIDTTMVHNHAAVAGVQVGIDLQAVNSLPVANDYWGHEFYVGMFDRSEIAYAVVQSDPRTHLAGCWCAKEALRKCDPSFLNIGFNSTVVAHERDGRPYMKWLTPSGSVRLPHALSLSHTGELATAVVMAVAFPLQPIPHRETQQNQTPSPTAAEPTESPRPGGPSCLRWILYGAVALLVLGAIVGIVLLPF